jgi:hypothetical protein
MSDYIENMTVVATDQFRGRLHECPVCGKRVWSTFGHARRHWEKCRLTPLAPDRAGSEHGDDSGDTRAAGEASC